MWAVSRQVSACSITQSFSHVRLFTTPWTLAHQAPLVHEIFQSRILEWLAIFLLQGIFLILGLNPCLLCLLHWQTDYLSLVLPDWHHQGLNLALQADSLPSEPQGSPWETKDRGK